MSPRAIIGTSSVAEPFWEATKEKRLVLQRCGDCEKFVFYPREFCPHCFGESLSWQQVSGEGTVYALSVMHKPGNPLMAGQVPYAVALVELKEGVRMLSNLVGCKPEEGKVGMKVRVSWEALPDGRNLPLFEPL